MKILKAAWVLIFCALIFLRSPIALADDQVQIEEARKVFVKMVEAARKDNVKEFTTYIAGYDKIRDSQDKDFFLQFTMASMKENQPEQYTGKVKGEYIFFVRKIKETSPQGTATATHTLGMKKEKGQWKYYGGSDPDEGQPLKPPPFSAQASGSAQANEKLESFWFDPSALKVSNVSDKVVAIVDTYEPDKRIISFKSKRKKEDAEKVLKIIQYYKIDEKLSLGLFTYFLAMGKPPEGPYPGEECQFFNPSEIKLEEIQVKSKTNTGEGVRMSWALKAGDKALFYFGKNKEMALAAKQDFIEKYGVNNHCRVGAFFYWRK